MTTLAAARVVRASPSVVIIGVPRHSASLAEATDQLSAAKGQNEQLLQDLESLLSQRGSLDALRTTLTRLLPPELGPALAEASA